jgi:indolepyruvate ferredoxin oxidoreductase beta subunit
MKTDIILAGVGGQGILTIAATIGYAALVENLHVKQSEVHGMSQRGGAVQSHFRLSSLPVASDLIPLGSADLILSVEPMESLRYLPYMAPSGWLVTNSVPFVNITDYPAMEKILGELDRIPHHLYFDADAAARECGSPKSANMVLLGAASGFIGIPVESMREGIRQVFRRKGPEIVESNLIAFQSGRDRAGL